MATRPPFKQSSFGPSEQAYEMKPFAGDTTVSTTNCVGEVTETVEEDASEGKGATATDQQDMHRLGKKQELRRNFRFLSIFGYSLLLGNGWVLSTIGLLVPLSNGGTAGVF